MLSWDFAQVAVFQNAQILHNSNVSNLKICIVVPFFNRVWEKMKPIFTPNAPCHLLVWVKATELDQSCFKSFTGTMPPQGSLQKRFTTVWNSANIDTSIRQWLKPTLETNKRSCPFLICPDVVAKELIFTVYST